MTYGATIRTSAHDADDRRPRIHVYTSRTTSEWRCNRNVWIAVVSDTIATPARTSVTPDLVPPNAAPTTYVTATVARAKRNAIAGAGSTGQSAVDERATVNTIVAPSPAPAAAPSRYGSTSGLRNTPW